MDDGGESGKCERGYKTYLSYFVALLPWIGGRGKVVAVVAAVGEMVQRGWTRNSLGVKDDQRVCGKLAHKGNSRRSLRFWLEQLIHGGDIC